MRYLVGFGLTSAAAAALLWPAGSGAAARYQRQYFKATFTGSQQQSWTQDYTSTGCGTTVRSRGSGSSRLQLRSPQPFYMVAVRVPRLEPLMLVLGHERGFRVTGTYVRDGKLTITSSGGTGCGDGGGTSVPKDCGTRALSGYMQLKYLSPHKWPTDPAPLVPSLLPSGPQPGSSSGQLYKPFRNCPGGGGDQFGESSGPLTLARLFGGASRLTVHGHGSDVQSSSGYRSTTSTTWTLTLTRMPRAPVIRGATGAPQCADWIDNDGDRLVDWEDPGCRRSGGKTETG